MTDFVCPNCRGGFPEPENLGECPWCGQSINGSYERRGPASITRTVETKEKDDRVLFGGGEGLFNPFFARLRSEEDGENDD